MEHFSTQIFMRKRTCLEPVNNCKGGGGVDDFSSGSWTLFTSGGSYTPVLKLTTPSRKVRQHVVFIAGHKMCTYIIHFTSVAEPKLFVSAPAPAPT
jgi:hypothetical protein